MQQNKIFCDNKIIQNDRITFHFGTRCLFSLWQHFKTLSWKYRMWNGFSSFHCLWVEFSIFMFQTHFWWDWNVDMLTHFGTQIKGSHSMCPPTIVTGCFSLLYVVLYNRVFFIPNLLSLHVTRNRKPSITTESILYWVKCLLF